MVEKKKVFKIVAISLLVLLLLIISFFTYLLLSYSSWHGDFEKDINIESLNEDVGNNLIEEKIEEISSRSDDTVILELSTEEISFLILESFQGNESLDIENVYISPIEKGRWNIYMKVRVLEKRALWVGIKMRKEDRETAEIFAEDILIGEYSLESLGLDGLIDRINEALSSALLTVEENGFVGRTFENIELLDTGLILRLEKY